MKMLVIGIDGGHINAYKRGWTPFIESLIGRGYSIDLKEDLLSRGWCEILTGRHGSETGALYDKPLINQTYSWNLKFKISDIEGLEDSVVPIWKKLNMKGYSVGIMNVPTTFPAPVVDGFFVSGGGGGGDVVQDPHDEMCYPNSIMDILKKLNYIVDERFHSLIYEKKIRKFKDIFNQLSIKNKNRTNSFLELYKMFNVDFGFIVYKSSSVITEMFIMPELFRKSMNYEDIDYELLSFAEQYYKEFDKNIDDLVQNTNPDEVLLVSDHGMCVAKHRVNLNYFLNQSGFFSFNDKNLKNKNIVSTIKKIAKPFVPLKFRRTISNLNSVLNKSIFCDYSKSQAFCMPQGDWGAGIYINDFQRFSGKVKFSDAYKIACEISSHINDSQIFKSHKIFSYVSSTCKNRQLSFFPDIIVDVPDGYLISNKGDCIVSDISYIDKKMNIDRWLNNFDYYTIKGSKPIAICNKQWNIDPKTNCNSLCLIYDHILNSFGVD